MCLVDRLLILAKNVSCLLLTMLLKKFLVRADYSSPPWKIFSKLFNLFDMLSFSFSFSFWSLGGGIYKKLIFFPLLLITFGIFYFSLDVERLFSLSITWEYFFIPVSYLYILSFSALSAFVGDTPILYLSPTILHSWMFISSYLKWLSLWGYSKPSCENMIFFNYLGILNWSEINLEPLASLNFDLGGLGFGSWSLYRALKLDWFNSFIVLELQFSNVVSSMSYLPT